MTTIPLEVAEELLWSNADDPERDIAHVASVHLGASRWTNDYLVVFRQGDSLLGFTAFEPATEAQEGMDAYDIFEGYHEATDSVYCKPVREVQTVSYEVMG